jgi:hypothetical protein
LKSERAGVPSRSADQLLTEFQRVIHSREAEFLRGVGDGPEGFMVLVFVKEMLITQTMRLGQYELLPFNALSCHDELALFQRFLREAELPLLPSFDETIRDAETGQPTLVVHFPLIRADNATLAGTLAERETDLLTSLLALYRGGAGAIWGVYVLNRRTVEIHYRINTPHYGGNLLGGMFSGGGSSCNPRSNESPPEFRSIATLHQPL